MKSETLSESSTCPLCGVTQENPDNWSMVWSDFCRCHICTQCTMALSTEFYNKESRLFATAARLLSLDIWECKKRYLLDSIEKTKEQLPHEVERNIIGFLKTSIIRCTSKIEAIDRFLEECKMGVDPDKLAEEERKLQETLSAMPF